LGLGSTATAALEPDGQEHPQMAGSVNSRAALTTALGRAGPLIEVSFLARLRTRSLGHHATLSAVMACHQAAGRLGQRTHCCVQHLASPFRCLHTFHEVLHPIQALVPDRMLLCQPAFGGCERFWRKLKTTNAPFLVRPYQAALFKHRKMLRK
jgi:hypothetical protein